jgi:hypothetical protein
MGSILSALFSAALNAILKAFGVSPEQKLGRMEVKTNDLEKQTKDLSQALAADHAVDADVSGELCDKLNKRLN